MGKLESFVSAVLGGAVVLAGQFGLNSYENHQKELVRQASAPHLRMSSYDGEKLSLIYKDAESVSGMQVKARQILGENKHGARYGPEIDLINVAGLTESSRAMFTFPFSMAPDHNGEEYIVWATDRDGNKSEPTEVSCEGKWARWNNE